MLNRGEEARSARAFVPYLSHGRLVRLGIWLRGRDLNPRPLGYEPNELPDCSTPRQEEIKLTTHQRAGQCHDGRSRATPAASRYLFRDCAYVIANCRSG